MSDLLKDMRRTELELRRGVIREHRLCCPQCGGRIILEHGRLRCVGDEFGEFLAKHSHDDVGCDWEGTRLAELAEVTW